MTGAVVVQMFLVGAMLYGIGTGQYMMAILAAVATALVWEER